MANEFKVKKGLIVDGSNTVLDIQGTQGQLFSVTDDLTGDLFSVSDVSGIPIFNVNSSGLSTFDGDMKVDGGEVEITSSDNDTILTIANTKSGGQTWKIHSASSSSAPAIAAGDFLIRNGSTNVFRLGGNNNYQANFAGVLSLPDGSVGAPAICNTGDANTGMYWPNDHQLGFTVNNSRKFYMAETKAYFQNLSSGIEISAGGLEINAGGIDATGDSTFVGTFNVKNHANTNSIATQFMNGKKTSGTGPFGELIFSNNNDSVATVAGFRDGADNKGSLVFQTQDGANGFGTRLTINSAGSATFTGNIDVNGTASDIAFVGGSMNFKDSNDYVRITKSQSSAQLGLFRSTNAVGGMYIGGNETGFRIYTESFAQKFLLDQSGNATFAGSLDVNASNASTFYALELSRSGTSATTPDIWGGSNVFVIGTSSSTEVISLSGSDATFAGDVEIHNEGNDTTGKLTLSGNNNTGTPGQKTSATIEHRGEHLKTVITHNGSDVITIGTGTDTTFAGSITSGSDIYIPVGEALFFGGSEHTYIMEDVDDRLRFFTGGTEFMRFTEGASDTVDIYKNATFAGDITQADGKRIWFRGSSTSTATGGQSYIFSDGLNLKIKGDDNVKILGDGGGTIAHFDYTGNTSFNTTQTPIAVIQSKAATFSGANGVHANSRLGIMNNGNLTSIVNASTYNDATYPGYGFVLIQGPSTSNYNVWSMSPDGPAKGNDLNFIYKANTTNIHTQTPILKLHGNSAGATLGGDFNIDSLSSSGSTVLDVQGTEGQLFSVTNSLTGDLFSVSDISGVPILNVNSSGETTLDGDLTQTSGNATFSGSVRVEDRIDLYNGVKVLQLKNVNNEFTIRNGNSGHVPLTISSAGNLTVGGSSSYGGTGVGSINIQATDYPVLAYYAGTTLRTQIISYSNKTYFGHASASSTWEFNNGSARASISSAGLLTVANDVVAFGSPSDKRLKENIKPIESALDKVSKLQGVTFDWKKSDSILDIKEDIGFIAQDVKEVIPELVRENEDGMLSMRHQGIAPILLEAIKELKAEIEELKKQIK